MAFETGTSTSPSNLLSKLVTRLTTDGWTITRTNGAPGTQVSISDGSAAGGAHFHFLADDTAATARWSCQPSRADAGSGVNFYAHTGSPDVSGTVIRASGFSVTIGRGCDALEPIAAFFAAVLASPLGLRVKLPGILVGTACLWLINLIRIVSLVLIGVHAPRAFDLAHGQVWQAAFIVLAIVFWAIWVQWATRSRAA